MGMASCHAWMRGRVRFEIRFDSIRLKNPRISSARVGALFNRRPSYRISTSSLLQQNGPAKEGRSTGPRRQRPALRRRREFVQLCPRQQRLDRTPALPFASITYLRPWQMLLLLELACKRILIRQLRLRKRESFRPYRRGWTDLCSTKGVRWKTQGKTHRYKKSPWSQMHLINIVFVTRRSKYKCTI